MSDARTGALSVNVVELNPYAPRPFVFTEAARCLRDSIQAAGYASVLSANEADLGKLNVVVGAVPPRLVAMEAFDPGKTVVFNLEQLGSNSVLVQPDYLDWFAHWTVADYHSSNVEFLVDLNGPTQRAFELPLVPGPSLRWPAGANLDKTVDVLFYGTESERRSHVIRGLRDAGLTVEVVAGAYGEELAAALQRARLVLHVHFYETGLFPIARMLQPVANGVPVVCERSVFSAGADWSQSGVLFADYDRLVDACIGLLASVPERLERASRAQRFAAQIDFARPFDHLLRSVLRGLAQRRTAGGASAGTPVASATQRTTEPAAVEGEGLSNEEIEAILAREASELPPEAHLPPRPVTLVERQLGQGHLGRWAAWLLLLFTLATVWQTLR